MVVMNLLPGKVAGECCPTIYSSGRQSRELALVQVFLDMTLSYRILDGTPFCGYGDLIPLSLQLIKFWMQYLNQMPLFWRISTRAL